MRTNIEIDDELMAEAMKVAGTKTKRETVDVALRELVERNRRMAALDELFGKYPDFPTIEELRPPEEPTPELDLDPEALKRLEDGARRNRDD